MNSVFGIAPRSGGFLLIVFPCVYPDLPACCRQVLPPPGLGKEMISELENENGGVMESTRLKVSQYQVIPAEVLESHRKARLWGYLERNKMNNPVYYRLLSENGSFAGFKRVVTEFLSPGDIKWRLDSIPHDEDATQKLSRPAVGTATYPREKIVTTEQMRVTNPKSKDQSCTGLPASGDCPPMPKVKPPRGEKGPGPWHRQVVWGLKYKKARMLKCE